MTMRPRVRKLALTAHITASVGWLGAVAGFLALAVAVLTSRDPQTVRAAYLAAEPITWFVIVPLSLASLLTGLVSSLGSTWGLLRHYWVIFKLLLNLIATGVLLMYTQTVRVYADVAADPSGDLDHLEAGSFLLHSGGALLVLLAATVLAVYKPRGMTRYGQRKQHEQRRAPREQRTAPVP